jgi:hypothetical protein
LLDLFRLIGTRGFVLVQTVLAYLLKFSTCHFRKDGRVQTVIVDKRVLIFLKALCRPTSVYWARELIGDGVFVRFGMLHSWKFGHFFYSEIDFMVRLGKTT